MIKEILNKLKIQIFGDKMFVIVDGADNSVTLSEKLCDDINIFNLTKASVFMFRVNAADSHFGFIVNPILSPEEESQKPEFPEIQFNEKYKTIGFASNSVNRMLYDYNLGPGKYKLTVSKQAANETKYYKIEKPNAKHSRKQQKA